MLWKHHYCGSQIWEYDAIWELKQLFSSPIISRIWNIRGYNKGQESRNLNIRYSFTQCNNICLLLHVIYVTFVLTTIHQKLDTVTNVIWIIPMNLCWVLHFAKNAWMDSCLMRRGVIDALTDIFPVMTTKYLHGKNVRKYIFFMFITMLAHKKYIFHVNLIELLERH